MARHRTIPAGRSLFGAAPLVTLRGIAARIASWWPWTSTFRCDHCDVVQAAVVPTLAGRRRAHALATDHSRHGFHDGAPVVFAD